MMKEETRQRKIKRLETALDRLERGLFADMSIDQCINTIDWLWRFRYISKEQLDSYSDRVVEMLKYI